MARALWLADVLRGAGLSVQEDPGWKARGRSDFVPRGVIAHATAGGLRQSNDSAYDVLVHGREGLAGPISTVMIERGTHAWRPVASGASNHVRVGWAGNCEGMGNRDLIGIEAHHDNASEPWTEQAVDNYARGVAAICRQLGVGIERVALHKEHQPGEKTDPTFNGNQFRARVAVYLGGSAHLPIPIPGDSMGVADDAFGNGYNNGQGAAVRPDSWMALAVERPLNLLLQAAAASAQREQDLLAAIGSLTDLIAAAARGEVDTETVVAAVKAHIDRRSSDVADQVANLRRAVAERDARLTALSSD